MGCWGCCWGMEDPWDVMGPPPPPPPPPGSGSADMLLFSFMFATGARACQRTRKRIHGKGLAKELSCSLGGWRLFRR